MAIRLSLAGVHEVDGVWPVVAEGMEKACRRTGGDQTAHHLWEICRSGAGFLVIAADDAGLVGASVWQFQNWTSGKKLRCLALFGRDFASWVEDQRKFTMEMARVGGATSIVAEGRRGWERLFPEAKLLRQVYEAPVT